LGFCRFFFWIRILESSWNSLGSCWNSSTSKPPLPSNRSILTVPWIELGGNVTINCPKTGYHAEIDFLTKPFYGGKRNKIQGEVYAPNEKKSFLSIYGEWSGLMEAKWNDGSRSKPEVFVDVNRIPIFKKQVRSVMEQEENESRRIWREVTAGLK
jgi:oxysterol-binding protein-related protein 9/10/11